MRFDIAFITTPPKGYGIFIENMLNQMEPLAG